MKMRRGPFTMISLIARSLMRPSIGRRKGESRRNSYLSFCKLKGNRIHLDRGSTVSSGNTMPAAGCPDHRRARWIVRFFWLGKYFRLEKPVPLQVLRFRCADRRLVDRRSSRQHADPRILVVFRKAIAEFQVLSIITLPHCGEALILIAKKQDFPPAMSWFGREYGSRPPAGNPASSAFRWYEQVQDSSRLGNLGRILCLVRGVVKTGASEPHSGHRDLALGCSILLVDKTWLSPMDCHRRGKEDRYAFYDGGPQLGLDAAPIVIEPAHDFQLLAFAGKNRRGRGSIAAGLGDDW